MTLAAIGAALKAVWASLKGWFAPLSAFFAGRESAENQREREDLKDALETDRRIADRISDPDERDRVRERYRAPPGAGNP